MFRKKTIYFPHIMKCSGSTIKEILHASGINCFFDYDHPPNCKGSHLELCKQRNKEFNQLNFSPFRVVYGHFPINRYKTKNNVIALLREPMERLISHYNYLKYNIPKTWGSVYDRWPEVYDIQAEKMDIVEFATTAEINKFYYDYLLYRNTKHFLHVGFTDQLNEFVKKISELIGFDINRVPQKIRRNTTHKKDPVNSQQASYLKTFLKEEISWFNAQSELWR